MNRIVESEAYAERVYAGVLGKIIGVYLGRPIENWSHERILAEFGEIDRYVASERKAPLVVADDDITGTFTFFRALEDHGYDPGLTPAQIGETWLNYLVEGRTVLWWGGMGASTEHTAYLRLASGVPAPRSGSIALNGKTVAEQIGAQIFIEGWGLVHPGDPAAAADLARRAASVSHDGEAVHGAQVVAALVALAFVETDVRAMIEGALACVPAESTIARLIGEVCGWRDAGMDWYAAYGKLREEYGYDKFPGGCHMVPNHGVVILALLYGDGDFSRSLMVANTCGWDTDCNSANVGSIVGVLGGLAGIDAGYDWRGPVRDRILLPTADGGRCVSDAVVEARKIVEAAHALHRIPYRAAKDGARFSFGFPGSVQGFEAQGAGLQNVDGALAVSLLASSATVSTATFPGADVRRTKGYAVVCSPTLSPGQTVRARVRGKAGRVRAALGVWTLTGEDEGRLLASDPVLLGAGEEATLEFRVPDLGGYPTTDVGLVVEGEFGDGLVLDRLGWDGCPDVTLERTPGGVAWRDAWVDGVSELGVWGESFRLIQNRGTGLLIHGSREWTDLCVEAEITVHLVENAGLGVRVQGMRRYYALRVVRDGRAQLVKMLDGGLRVLDERPFAWSFGDRIAFRLAASGNRLRGSVGGAILEAGDDDRPLRNGGVAFVLTEGRVGADSVRVRPT